MPNWNAPLPWLSEKVRKSMVTELRLDQFVARLMFAPRLEGDTVFSLPPGRAAEVIHLDCLPAAPKDWVRSRGSYVVPVDTGFGIWFDFRNGFENDLNTAVVPSVKGMNPFTGQKIETLRLESYVEKCPTHQQPFKGSERLCEKCGWTWPPQNYLTQDSGWLWVDGFRQNGLVRQFYFSDEDKRDIASLVIGKENTVPAFGFAFWSPKNRRIIERAAIRDLCGGQSIGYYDTDYDPSAGLPGPSGDGGTSGARTYWGVSAGSGRYDGQSVYYNNSFASDKTTMCSAQGSTQGMANNSVAISLKSHSVGHKCSKSVSVGAGARINQELAKDSLGLEGWKDEPEAIIRLYFVFEEQFHEIVRGGIKELKGDKEGYLKNLPVG